jgi:hypothetical protein
LFDGDRFLIGARKQTAELITKDSVALLKRQNPFLNCSADRRLWGPVAGRLPHHNPCRLQEDVAMTAAAKRKEIDLDYLLHPAGAFRTPMDVVSDPDMTVQEKRAILASWASDACAVESAPDLRRPPSAPSVRFDDVLDALKELDREAAPVTRNGKLTNRLRRWKDRYRGCGGAHSLNA